MTTIDLPQTQTAEVEFTGRRGVYRLINVDRERWLVYGKGAVQYVGMLIRTGVTFTLHPMLPHGGRELAGDLDDLALVL